MKLKSWQMIDWIHFNYFDGSILSMKVLSSTRATFEWMTERNVTDNTIFIFIFSSFSSSFGQKLKIFNRKGIFACVSNFVLKRRKWIWRIFLELYFFFTFNVLSFPLPKVAPKMTQQIAFKQIRPSVVVGKLTNTIFCKWSVKRCFIMRNKVGNPLMTFNFELHLIFSLSLREMEEILSNEKWW